jgi:hypothetical protein
MIIYLHNFINQFFYVLKKIDYCKFYIISTIISIMNYFIASTPLIIYGCHQYFRNKYASAIINYESEQQYQSDRYKSESYHFEKMDDKAYYRAISNYNFWKYVAQYCPCAQKRIEKPIVRIGGGGS